MKILITILLLLKCSTSIGQKIPLDTLISMYKMDSTALKKHCDDEKLKYSVSYHSKVTFISFLNGRIERIFNDSAKFDKWYKYTHSQLVYSISDSAEFLNDLNTLHKLGFVVDAAETKKISDTKSSFLYCCSRNEIEIMMTIDKTSSDQKNPEYIFGLFIYRKQD